MLADAHISPLVVAFLMAGALRIAQGSATVSIITAAGIMAPMVKALPNYRPEMIYFALCCGGTALSHVNDAGFWIVNQYFGLTVPQTLKTWTAMKVVSGVVGFAIVLGVNAL
jgi:H+/gluconate symporter-like permease